MYYLQPFDNLIIYALFDFDIPNLSDIAKFFTIASAILVVPLRSELAPPVTLFAPKINSSAARPPIPVSKVIIEKSRGEGSLMEQDTIKNVS